MFSKKKNYKDLLSNGIPSVIAYEYREISNIPVVFQRQSEHISYDKKDIYNSPEAIQKIDVKKAYFDPFG